MTRRSTHIILVLLLVLSISVMLVACKKPKEDPITVNDLTSAHMEIAKIRDIMNKAYDKAESKAFKQDSAIYGVLLSALNSEVSEPTYVREIAFDSSDEKLHVTYANVSQVAGESFLTDDTLFQMLYMTPGVLRWDAEAGWSIDYDLSGQQYIDDAVANVVQCIESAYSLAKGERFDMSLYREKLGKNKLLAPIDKVTIDKGNVLTISLNVNNITDWYSVDGNYIRDAKLSFTYEYINGEYENKYGKLIFHPNFR